MPRLSRGLFPIQRFIRENNLKQPREGTVKERRAFEKSRFGQLWQADTASLPYITDESGKSYRTYVIMIIDDHSRMIVGAEIFYNDNSLNNGILLEQTKMELK